MSFGSKEFKSLNQAIQSARKIVVSTHTQPDGDGLGAEAALYHYLESAKKSARICNPDELPKRYQFLDPEKKYLFSSADKLWDQFDLWIIVDTNDPRRLGHLWKELPTRAKQIFFLDHHADFDQTQGTLQLPSNASVVCNTHASSIGELLWQAFNELKLVEFNYDIALGLYVSVMTDTNSFRYAMTTPESHRIAADMIALGIDPEEVYQSVYSSKDLSHIHLLGSLLAKTKASPSGHVAWLEITLEDRKKFNASSDDTSSFLNFLLLLRDAEVVCIFREEDDGKTIRASLKSKGKVVINTLALEFGGGGHDYAAGFALQKPLSEVVSNITSKLETLVVGGK